MEPQEIALTTRHGDTLRGDLYLPAGEGPHPVLVLASPYQKALGYLPVHPIYPFRETGPIPLYLRHGYAVAWFDVPGSGRSTGTWDPVSRREGEAIADAIEWLAAQPWCSGRVGMLGQSYYCWSQWNAARVQPPHLVTIVAYDGSTDLYRDWMYKGGIPDWGFGSSWWASLLLQHQAQGHPIRGGGRDRFLPDMYEHPWDDEWHRRRAPFWELDQVTIPVLSIGSFAKGPIHLRGNVEGFRRLAGPKRLLLLDLPSPADTQALFADEAFHERELLPWYEHHLKGVDNHVMDLPPVRIQVRRAARLRSAEAWPPPGGAPVSFFLSGEKSGVVRSLNDGSLVPEAPTAGPASTSWSYPDPQWRAGTSAFDREGRPDHIGRILTFTSAPFPEEREFTGDGYLHLYASTDQEDLDVVVRLSVLAADGRAERVSQGWLRASHRAEDPELTLPLRPFHSHQRPEPVPRGEPVELRIPLLPLSFVVRPGERLRLEVANGDSPLTEGRHFQWYGLKVGTDTYHHSRAHPSRLVLPEVPVPHRGG